MRSKSSFIAEHEDLPILVKTALVHVQFETDSPRFLDAEWKDKG